MPAYTREFKQNTVAEFNKSNLSQREFCSLKGICRKALRRWMQEPTPEHVDTRDSILPRGVKILFIDIETAPTIGVFYDRKVNFISPKQIIQHGFMLSVQYAWGMGEVRNVNLRNMGIKPKRGMYSPDDCKPLVEFTRNLINEADMVVAHNGDRFDIAKINAYIRKHQLKPMHQPPSCDTLKLAKRIAKHESNSLADLNKYYDIELKDGGGFGYETAVQCMAGVDAAWDKTEKYGDQDIIALRELYLATRQYATGNLHPNMNLFYSDTKTRCPVCASVNHKWSNKPKYTTTQVYDTAQCSNCGHIFQDKRSALCKEKREAVVKSC